MSNTDLTTPLFELLIERFGDSLISMVPVYEETDLSGKTAFADYRVMVEEEGCYKTYDLVIHFLDDDYALRYASLERLPDDIGFDFSDLGEDGVLVLLNSELNYFIKV